MLPLLTLLLLGLGVDPSPAEGTLWGWGANRSGRLCDGTITAADRLEPFEMQAFGRDVVAAAAGVEHLIVLKADGTVWACGHGAYVGTGGTNAPSPVRVFEDAVAIAAGGWHSLALKKDGTVWVWGGYGATLGTGTDFAHVPTPVVHAGGSPFGDIVAISTQYRHSLALDIYGRVWSWGWNESGQVGDGTREDRRHPVEVEGSPGLRPPFVQLTHISAGSIHSLAIRADGTVWAWGPEHNGTLGNGNMSFGHRTRPVQVEVLTQARAIAAGYMQSLALQGDSVWHWGVLHPDIVLPHTVPTQRADLSGVRQIATGGGHHLVLLNDGTVRAWGFNINGQLGIGSTDNRTTPTYVHNLKDVSAVFAEATSSFALVSPPGGLQVDVCALRDWACGPEPQLEPGGFTLQCDRPACIVVDRVPRNCEAKFPCPGCAARGLCPPIYHMTFQGLGDAWTVELRDGSGRPVVHKKSASRNRLVLSFRPDQERYRKGSIGDYMLVLRMTDKGRVGQKYRVKTALKVEHQPPQAKTSPRR
jgi:alpha-tubulin suppressor-like RCC1 family protein